MSDFELTPPRPDQSPQTDPQATEPSARLFDWPDIEGKTVQAVIDQPSGRRSADVHAVLVFTDGTWLTIGAEGDSDGEEGCWLNLGNSWSRGDGHQISDYLTASELLNAGLLNTGQYEFLKNRETEQRKKDDAARAAKLRAEADRLEGGAA